MSNWQPIETSRGTTLDPTLSAQVGGTAYRIESTIYAAPLNEYDEPSGPGRQVVRVERFEITKVTAAGIWIDHWAGPKFVLLTARKKFACLSLGDAKESFAARKRRQISILSGQLGRAEQALEMVGALREGKDTAHPYDIRLAFSNGVAA